MNRTSELYIEPTSWWKSSEHSVCAPIRQNVALGPSTAGKRGLTLTPWTTVTLGGRAAPSLARGRVPGAAAAAGLLVVHVALVVLLGHVEGVLLTVGERGDAD